MTRSVTLSETKGLVFSTEILRLRLRMTFQCLSVSICGYESFLEEQNGK